MKDKSYIIYILCAIIGFLAFEFSIYFGESKPILIIVGIAGNTAMAYCIYKIIMNFNKHNT